MVLSGVNPIRLNKFGPKNEAAYVWMWIGFVIGLIFFLLLAFGYYLDKRRRRQIEAQERQENEDMDKARKRATERLYPDTRSIETTSTENQPSSGYEKMRGPSYMSEHGSHYSPSSPPAPEDSANGEKGGFKYANHQMGNNNGSPSNDSKMNRKAAADTYTPAGENGFPLDEYEIGENERLPLRRNQLYSRYYRIINTDSSTHMEDNGKKESVIN